MLTLQIMRAVWVADDKQLEAALKNALVNTHHLPNRAVRKTCLKHCLVSVNVLQLLGEFFSHTPNQQGQTVLVTIQCQTWMHADEMKVYSKVFLKWITHFIHQALLLQSKSDCSHFPVPPVASVWFHMYLILSNPGVFAVNLRHHKLARRMIENRMWVNILWFLFIINLVPLCSTFAFTKCVKACKLTLLRRKLIANHSFATLIVLCTNTLHAHPHSFAK